jgi:NADH-quinone oxidoreductase subunit A
MIYGLLTSPAAAFTIILSAAVLAARLLSKLAFKRKGGTGALDKSYSCGEDAIHHLIQPDYSQFFPFAFFFTILHVIALIVTTVPVATIENFTIAVIYIVGAIVGLFILFRK